MRRGWRPVARPCGKVRQGNRTRYGDRAGRSWQGHMAAHALATKGPAVVSGALGHKLWQDHTTPHRQPRLSGQDRRSRGDVAGVNQCLSLTSLKLARQVEHWALLAYRGVKSRA